MRDRFGRFKNKHKINVGRQCSNETKMKIGDANRGRSPAHKGKALPEEWRMNISKANKGKIMSEDVREKIRRKLVGIKRGSPSLEARQKMSESHKGMKFSLEHRKNISLANKKRIGELSPRWKGGVTPLNRRRRNRKDVFDWRKKVFERDFYSCQMPNCKTGIRYLEAHHIKTVRDFPEFILELSNGITLCRLCHQKTKWKEQSFENIFSDIIKSKSICF